MTFLDYVITTFQNFGWHNAAEILLLFFFVYFCFAFFKKNRAVWLAYILTICVLITFCFSLIALPAAKAVICMLLALIVIVPFILFSGDIRRALFKLTWKDFLGENKDQDEIDAEILQQCAEQTVKACLDMSKNDVGALIVFANAPIDSIIESGSFLNANLSSELLETIFFPRSPLHDGAVMVVGNKILAASCYLPLTARSDFPKEFGTRHRAAIGISEQFPMATAIVVSEETGIISACHDGKIIRYLSNDTLLSVVMHALKLSTEEGEEAAIWGVNYEE